MKALWGRGDYHKQGLSTGATMGLLIFLSDLGESLGMTNSPDIFLCAPKKNLPLSQFLNKVKHVSET
jgi:hypothetical protein